MNYSNEILCELHRRPCSYTLLKTLLRRQGTLRGERFSPEAFCGALDDLLHTGRITRTLQGQFQRRK